MQMTAEDSLMLKENPRQADRSYTRMKRGGNRMTDTQTKSSRVSWRKLQPLSGQRHYHARATVIMAFPGFSESLDD